MSGEVVVDEVLRWLDLSGIRCIGVEPVAGGTNNRVFCVETGEGKRLLKISARRAGDVRDRFGAESDFYDLLERGSVVCVPRRLVENKNLGAALYEWVEGQGVQVPVGESQLNAALSFLGEVERVASVEMTRLASEACFSVVEHCELVERRVEALRVLTTPEVVDFVETRLRPRWKAVERGLKARAEADFAATGGQRVMSPGDFGFHNALRRMDGSIVFFDFEYSGWDDPAKTVADIFLQPEKPVDFGYWPGFCEAMQQQMRLDEGFVRRANALLPLFAVKWSCILLNRLIKDVVAGCEAVKMQVVKAQVVLVRGEEFCGA